MLFLAFGESDFALDSTFCVMQVEWNKCVARSFYFSDQFLDFIAIEQQFAGAHGVGADVRRCGSQGADMRSEQEHFTLAHNHIGFFELNAASADGFDFPTFQYHACLIAFFNKVIKEGFFIINNRHGFAKRKGQLKSRLYILPNGTNSMAVVQKSVLLGYSAEQMFDLVDRVEDYPKFLPWCGGVDVLEREERKLVATLVINYHGVKQRFTTENINNPPTSMRMRLVEGPFRHLDGMWTFKPLRADACKVEFELQYEFSSRILEQIIGPVFGVIANSFVDSFRKRAEAVYG